MDATETASGGRLPAVLLLRPGGRHRRPAAGRRRADEGEIQGWVFVTVMTAGLVFAIWTLAEDQLGRLFQQALSSVTGG